MNFNRTKSVSRLLTIGILFILVFSGTPSFGQLHADEDEKEELKENPAERDRFRHMQRADHDGEVAFGALTNAKAQIDRMRFKANARIPDDAGIGNWEWLGPGNIGGRIRTILIHPTNTSTMWIGSVSGGIWRSGDGGSSWQPVDDFMANLAVTSIVMDPTNTNVMYATTGEDFGNTDALQGAGIFKSIDGGVTWHQLPSTNDPSFHWINRLAHHPSLPNTLIAVTSSGVRRTQDGGMTWPVVLDSSLGTDVKYNPSNGDMVMVGTRRAVLLSTDGGTNWANQTTGALHKLPSMTGRCEVAFTAANNSYLYTQMNLNGGELWRSIDGGATWDSMSTTLALTFGWYANAIAVSPVNPDFVIIGGLNISISNDGGKTFSKVSESFCYPNCAGLFHSTHADQHAIVFDPGFDGSANRKVYVGNDGGIQMAPDILGVGGPFGDGWINLANGLGITQFYGGAASPDGSFLTGGTQDNRTLKFNGGTNNWSMWAQGDGGFCAIDFSTPDIAYEEYTYLQIYKSVDRGGSYLPVYTTGIGDAGNSDNALFIAPFSMDPNSSQNLVAGGASIWRTSNAAGFWGSIRNALPKIDGYTQLCSAIDIAKGNSSVIWVGYNTGTVSFTTNAGTTWTDVNTNPPGLPRDYITDIAINPTNSSEVFVTFGRYDTDRIWMTTNSGSTWLARQGAGLTGVPALQVNTVRYHPANPDWVYVGTDLGIFASEDKGLTWETTPRYGIHDGPANVEVDELFWQGDEYLIAATHGRGMYRCRPLATVFVDSAYVGVEDGSQFKPYNTIPEGIDAAGNGTSMSIKRGMYVQPVPLVMGKRMRVTSTSGNATIK